MKVNKVKHAIIAAFAAVFAFVAPAVAANVAKIGDTEYATLDAAINAWNEGDEIKLLCDIDIADYFVKTKNFVIDGCGYTLKCIKAHDGYNYFVNNNGYTQTFKNITIDGNKQVAYAAQCINTSSTLILDNVTLKGGKTTLLQGLMGYGLHINKGNVIANDLKVSNCDATAVYIDSNKAAGGSFTLTGDNCDLDAVGVAEGTTPTLSITAKGFSVYDVSAKYSYSIIFGTREGTKNLSNVISALSWNQAISEIQSKISGLSVKVKSATVTLKGDVKFKEDFTSNESRLTVDGAGKTVTGKFIFNSSTPSTVKNIVLGNGSVLDCTASMNTGFSGVSVAANTTIDILLPASTDMNSYALPVALATDAVANIFVGDKKYIAKNGVISSAEKLAQIGDKQYATLQEAIDAANGGATVQVLKDVALTSSLTVPAGKTLMLNLAGRKVTVSGADYALVNNGNLTIVDMDLVTVVAAEATIGDDTTTPILIMAPSANDGVAVIDDATGGSIAGVQNNGTFALESGAVVAASASVPAIDNTANAVAIITGGTVEGKLQSTDKTALTITGGSFIGESNVSEFVGGDFGVDSNGTIVKNVAKIGEVGYLTLDDAVKASTINDTITLLQDAELTFIDDPMYNEFNAKELDLNGKTLTIKEGDIRFSTITIKNGNIVVQPGTYSGTAIFLMYGKTLTFNGVNITATGVASTYLIGLENGEGVASNLNLINSSIVIDNPADAVKSITVVCANCDADIVIDNTDVDVKNIDGRGFHNGDCTVKNGSNISLLGVSKAGFRVNSNQKLSIEDTSVVTVTGVNGAEPRDGGINIVDATGSYTKADTATVNASIKAPAVAKIGTVEYITLADALSAAQAGDTVELLSDASVEGTAQIPAGVTIKSNGYKILGSIRMLGDLTLDGALEITGGLWVGKAGETLAATLAGDKLTASYFMFQYGSYTIDADIDAVYGYLSFEGEFEVNSTITTSNTNGEPLYLRGQINLNEGASFIVKNLFLDNANTVLKVKKGASITASSGVSLRTAGAQLYSSGDISGSISAIDGTTVSLTGGTYTQDVAAWCAEGYSSVKQPGENLWQVGKLPNAEVVNMGPTEVSPDSYFIFNITNGTHTSNHKDPFDLQITLNFIAKDSAEKAAENAYGDYITDFRIKIDGLSAASITADENCYLAGYYAGMWVKVNLKDFVIENGVGYPVISALFPFTYEDICRDVKNFICGIHLSDDVLNANPNLKVSLDLGLSETQNDMVNGTGFVQVGETYDYTADEMRGPVAISGPDYFTTVTGAVAAALETGDSVKLVVNAGLEDNLAINRDLVFNLGGKTLTANGKTLAIANSVVTITNGTLSAFTKDNVTLTGNAVLTVTDADVAASFRSAGTYYVSQNANGTYSIMLKSAFRVFITMVDGEPRIGFFKDCSGSEPTYTLLGATNLENPDWQAVDYEEASDTSDASALPLYWAKIKQAANDANVYRFFKIGPAPVNEQID